MMNLSSLIGISYEKLAILVSIFIVLSGLIFLLLRTISKDHDIGMQFFLSIVVSGLVCMCGYVVGDLLLLF